MFGFNWWNKKDTQAKLARLTIRDLRDLVRSIDVDLEQHETMSYSAQRRLARVLKDVVNELSDIRAANALGVEAEKAFYFGGQTGFNERALTLVMLAKRYPLLGWVLWTVATPFVKRHEKEVVAEAEKVETRDERASR